MIKIGSPSDMPFQQVKVSAPMGEQSLSQSGSLRCRTTSGAQALRSCAPGRLAVEHPRAAVEQDPLPQEV